MIEETCLFIQREAANIRDEKRIKDSEDQSDDNYFVHVDTAVRLDRDWTVRLYRHTFYGSVGLSSPIPDILQKYGKKTVCAI